MVLTREGVWESEHAGTLGDGYIVNEEVAARGSYAGYGEALAALETWRAAQAGQEATP
jgi:hypothetical protein